MSTAAATETTTETADPFAVTTRKAALKNALTAFGVFAGGAAAIGLGIFVGGIPGGFFLAVGTLMAVRGWADLSLEGGRDRVLLDQQRNGNKEGFLDKLRKKRESLPKKLDMAVKFSLRAFILTAGAMMAGAIVPPVAPVAFAIMKLGVVATAGGLGVSEWIKGAGECIETILGPEKKPEAPVEKTPALVIEAPVATVASPAAGFEKAATTEKPATAIPVTETKIAVAPETPAAPK